MKYFRLNIYMKLKYTSAIIMLILLLTFNLEAQKAKTRILRDPGIYLGGIWSKDSKMMFVPQAWFYAKDFYVETRYNYEEENTFSVHLGKPFEIEELKTEVTPTVGLVFGDYKGYSVGLNTDFYSSHLSGSTENQYVFSSVNTNFFFSWLKVTTPITKNFGIGGSWQYTQEPFESTFDAGPMISFTKNAFEFQLFSYNPWKDTRYWMFGISLDLASKE